MFGLLALVRPEYLPLALGLPFVWLAREAWRKRARAALAPVALSLLATCLVLVPWTIHNAVELDRFVPISTGGGKALFIGTYLEADGDSVELREVLLDERPGLRAEMSAAGPVDQPGRLVLERVLERVADESYPELETDAALGRLGRQNLEDGLTEEPLRFTGMMAGKAYETWTDAARGVMLDQPWRALQLAVVFLSLAGVGDPRPPPPLRGARRRPLAALHDRDRGAADLLAPARARRPAAARGPRRGVPRRSGAAQCAKTTENVSLTNIGVSAPLKVQV